MADKALEVASQISNKQITGIISYWYNGQWINIADTNQRNNMQKSIDNLSGLDKTIATLPHSYYSLDQPTGTSYNDTDRWYKTSTDSDGTIKYTPYKWNSTTSSWKPMLDQSAIHTFIGSAPASPVEGDFWTDNGTLKQYQSGNWEIVPTKGDQGVPGTPGSDGKTYYTWIKYATDSSGSNMSNSPTGMSYIGLAYNKESETESSTATDYTWSLIKGDQGIPGKAGTDGKTSYFHIAYANSSDGSIGFTTSPSISTSYNYMGTYSDYTSTSSTSYSSYTWVAMFDSTKKRNFTNQPTTPYAIGDTWMQSGATYFCTTARSNGAFTASDWTMQQLTIQALDSSVTNSLYNDNLLTNTGDLNTNWVLGSGVTVDTSQTPAILHYPMTTLTSSFKAIALQQLKDGLLHPSTTYTASFYAKGTGTMLFYCYANVSNGASDTRTLIKLTSDYKLYTRTFTTVSNISGDKSFILRQDYAPVATDQNTVEAYVYGLKLEKGSVATDWCLSQSEITTTTGSYKGVTLNDAGLTATAGSTTAAMNSTDGFLIKNTSGQVFHVDTAGNLTMQGDITAGNISGVNFSGNNLTLAGILAVTGAISSQFSYTDDDSIKHDGETVISNGGIKTVDTQTMPTVQTNKPVTMYSFDSNGYRVITYKDDDAYKAGAEISSTYFDNNGIRMTMSDIKSSYNLTGFSGMSTNDNDRTLANVVFGDVLQYASSEAQHSGIAGFKDWFDIVSGIQSHPNLLHNSSLISGTNSWGGLTNGIIYTTNVTHDGNFAICIKSAGGSNFFYQDLQHIPDPGNTICVSFWANIVKNDGGANGGAFIKFNGANQNYAASLTNTKTGWQYYAFNPITVPNGTTGIQFSFYNNEHTGNQVYFAQPMVNIGTHTWPYMPTY